MYIFKSQMQASFVSFARDTPASLYEPFRMRNKFIGNDQQTFLPLGHALGPYDHLLIVSLFSIHLPAIHHMW